MSYQSHSHYSNPLQFKVKQLESEKRQLQADKNELSAAIQELNLCYQEKTLLLEATIAHQQKCYEQLLQWKQQHVGSSILEAEKYEAEIRKMIHILDNAHSQFETQQANLEQQLALSHQEIQKLKQENDGLKEERNGLRDENQRLKEEGERLEGVISELREEKEGLGQFNEDRIEEMVRAYTDEIGKLKEQLKALREESMSSEDTLRDISTQQNIENIAPNYPKPIFTKLLQGSNQ